MYILYIQPSSSATAEVYKTAATAYNARNYADRDAGFDLFCDDYDVRFNGEPSYKIGQGCSAAFYDTEKKLFRAFWLLPRSSISKKPLALANSVGLIDAGYRGQIMAAVRFLNNARLMDKKDYEEVVKAGERVFQLASPDLLPWDRVEVVSEIPGGATLRGAGGFGSTGVSGVAATGVAAAASADDVVAAAALVMMAGDDATRRPVRDLSGGMFMVRGRVGHADE